MSLPNKPLGTCVGILGWPPGTCADGPGWPLGTGLFVQRIAIAAVGRVHRSSAGQRFALWPLWTYELSRMTHVTAFLKYGKHSTWPSTYGLWIRTYRKSFSCKSLLTVCCYKAQSNEICMYGRVSRGSLPRVRRYGLLYLRTVEYDHWNMNRQGIAHVKKIALLLRGELTANSLRSSGALLLRR